jgi:cell division protein FtsL
MTFQPNCRVDRVRGAPYNTRTFMKLSREQTIIIGVAVAVVAVVVYFGITARQASHSVPAAFTDARAEAGRASQEISDLSRQVRDDLNKTQALEHQGKIAQAKPLLDDIDKTNTTIKNDTVTLSNNLTIMAKAVPDIGDRGAQPLALDAIKTDLQIVSDVISYNTDVGDLVGMLQDRLQGKKVNETRIDDLVKHINDEVDTINKLNTTATNQLQRFDTAIRSGQ